MFNYYQKILFLCFLIFLIPKNVIALPQCGAFPYNNCTGSHTYKNGNRYDGEWLENKRHGKGTYYYANGDKVFGDWDDNQLNGKGTYTSDDGYKYVGDWVNGKKNGKGIAVWSDGDKYEGEWKNNQQNGEGVYTSANGKKYEGIFKNGKLVTQKSVKQFKHSKPLSTVEKGKYSTIERLRAMYAFVQECYLIRKGYQSVYITRNELMRSKMLIESGIKSSSKISGDKNQLAKKFFNTLVPETRKKIMKSQLRYYFMTSDWHQGTKEMCQEFNFNLKGTTNEF